VADDTYDVFVSYSRADGRHAAEIDSVLRDKGLKTFFERRNSAAGLPWVRALEQAIGAAKAAIVLIGPRGLGNTQQYERELAFVRQTRDPAFPIVPVIPPEITNEAKADVFDYIERFYKRVSNSWVVSCACANLRRRNSPPNSPGCSLRPHAFFSSLARVRANRKKTRMHTRLSCKIDYLLRSNQRARSIVSEFFTDDRLPTAPSRDRAWAQLVPVTEKADASTAGKSAGRCPVRVPSSV
jgi:TIR domain